MPSIKSEVKVWDKIDLMCDEIEAYCNLKKGWDGCSAEPISWNVILSAKTYLNGIFNLQSVHKFSMANIVDVSAYPLPHGAIDVYIKYKSGAESTVTFECSSGAT